MVVSFPSVDKLLGKSKSENINIAPKSVIQPIIRGLNIFSFFPNKEPTRILPSSAPSIMIVCR